MTDDLFEMPDMDELAHQMKEAMGEAKKALEDLPDELGDLEETMGALSGLMGGLPTQMGELTGALSGFDEQHQENVNSLVGDPDWSLKADILVGKKLHIAVIAVFDLAKIQQTLASTQGAEFESLVADVVEENAGDLQDGMMGQIMGQLKKGRGTARVESVEVLSCRIQGAPADAEKELRLSPEANIPLVMDGAGIGFELAPLLTIRNQWDHAAIPTFSPMAAEIIVPLDDFEADKFAVKFAPDGQEEEISVELIFHALDRS